MSGMRPGCPRFPGPIPVTLEAEPRRGVMSQQSTIQAERAGIGMAWVHTVAGLIA